MERSSASDGAPRQGAAGQAIELALRESVLRALLVVVGISPFVAPLARRAMSPSAGDALYALFAPVCHLDPSRTLSLAGVLMPLCSRCAGIFAGLVTVGIVPAPRLRVGACLGAGVVVSVAMLADVITQDLGLRSLWHPARLATGIAWGHVLGLGILAIARSLRERALRATSSA